MLSSFLSRLKSIFRPMMSSSSNDSPVAASDTQSTSRFIPPIGKKTAVKDFMTGTIVDTLQYSDANLEWQKLSQHFVSKLVYYKRLAKGDKPQHEYIVAHIVDAEKKTARMRVERLRNESGEVTGNNKPEKTTYPLLVTLKTMLGEPISLDASSVPRGAPSIGLLGLGAGMLASSSRSVTSSNSTVESMPRSSQDSSFKAVEAEDAITTLKSTEVISDHVLRVFELGDSILSYLHFCIIVEAVHDKEPDYHLLRSQCYWFAIMVMGVSMLQGGRVQIYDKSQKKGTAERAWINMTPYTSINEEMPAGLERDLPVPSPSEEDIKHATNVAGAGTNWGITRGLMDVAVVRVPFATIWALGRETQDHYNALSIRLARVQNIVKAQIQEAEERALQADERAQRAEEEARREVQRVEERAAERVKQAEADKREALARAERAEAMLREQERQKAGTSRRRLDSSASISLPSTSEL